MTHRPMDGAPTNPTPASPVAKVVLHNSQPNVLAIDPGTKTGWALDVNGIVHSGTWNFTPRRGDGCGVRFLRLCWALDEVRQQTPNLRIVYELPAGHYKSGAADDCIKGLVAHIQSWCEAHDVPCEGYAPTELKKWATGKGNANKAAMLAEARRRWPDIGDDNEADARLLLAMSSATHANKEAQTPAWGGTVQSLRHGTFAVTREEMAALKDGATLKQALGDRFEAATQAKESSDA